MKILITTFYLLLVTNANSQNLNFEKDTAIIEKRLEREMEKAQGSIDMTNALINAESGYDKLLNQYYKLCLSAIKSEDRKFLIDVQKAWVAWKDNEIKLIELTKSNKYNGYSSMRQEEILEEMLFITKTRAIKIYEYYTLFSAGYGQ